MQRLYSYNARKFVLVGVGPIGCIPFVRVDDKHEECNIEMNHLSAKYYAAFGSVLKNIKSELKDIQYSYFEGHSVMQSIVSKPANYGTPF